jgi:P-type Mg2+ transporter
VPEVFRTAWFVESLLTELVVALVVTTHRPFFSPGAILLWSTVVLIPITLVLPYLPFAGLLGFVPLPGTLVIAVCAITAAYAIAVELVKRPFMALQIDGAPRL